MAWHPARGGHTTLGSCSWLRRRLLVGDGDEVDVAGCVDVRPPNAHVLFSLDLKSGRADFVLRLVRKLRDGHAGGAPRLVAELGYKRPGDALCRWARRLPLDPGVVLADVPERHYSIDGWVGARNCSALIGSASDTLTRSMDASR